MHTRKSVLKELKRLLENGASIQMFAPRRIGKTWVLEKLAIELKQDKWLVVYMDVEGIQSIEGFLAELCCKLQEDQNEGQKILRSLTQRVKGLVTEDWGTSPAAALSKVDKTEFAKSLIEALDKSTYKIAILIDEISWFVLELIEKESREVKSFLYTLRKFRQSCKNVRWFFTGSVGLDAVAQRHQLRGAFEGMKLFELKAFNQDEAKSYWQSLADDGVLQTPFTINDDDFDYLTEELGWLSPYYLELLANEITPSATAPSGELPVASRQEIEQAFKNLLSPQKNGCFAVWEEHVEKNFTPEESQQIRLILDACCQDIKGALPETLLTNLKENYAEFPRSKLMKLLSALASDGFLMKQEKRWCFCSGLVRRYWLEYQSE